MNQTGGNDDLTHAFSDTEVPEAKLVPPPDQLGDYRILREIGRGGMGIVYEAEQESLGRHVALKVLLANSILDPKQLSRFQREARAAARLHHTNIVPVFGVGTFQDTHYYVMQYIEGRGLDGLLTELRWLHKNQRTPSPKSFFTGRLRRAASPEDTTAVDVRPLDEANGDVATDEAPDPHHLPSSLSASSRSLDLTGTQPIRQYWQNVARIGRQVADALDYAHGQGILHRDIKPANLLLDTTGTVWVTDFGLAKATEQDNLTQTGDIIGTLRYMAPESFRGQYDQRTDIYALGLTLYELVTLRPAFDASDRNNLMRQVINAEVLAPRKINPAVPQDLETIVLKALDRDPSHRYQSGAELAADLDRFINDEPIRARRLNIGERFVRWCRRNPVVAALSVSLAAVFLVSFAVVTWQWRTAEARKQELAAVNDSLYKANNNIAKANDELSQANDEIAKQKGVAQKAAELAKAINTFLVDDMLAAATPEMARGKSISVEDVLDKAGQKIDTALEDQPEVEASVRMTIGTTFYRMGLYNQAEPHLRRALELSRTSSGKDAFETLAIMNNLADTLKSEGKLDEAEALYRESYDARLRKYGADEPETFGALNNLAELLQKQGKLVEAEKLLRESVEDHQRVLGPDDLDTLLALGSLGRVLVAAAKFDEAEPMLERTRTLLAKGLGDDHPHTLTAMHNLADLRHKQGRMEEAEKLSLATLEARRRVLGVNHRETITSLNQVVKQLMDQGRFSEAEPIAQEALKNSLHALGEADQQVIESRHNLARLLQAQHQLAKAEPLARENVEVCRRVLGPENRDTLQAMSSLALALQQLGKLDEAETLMREVVDSQRKVMGETHPESLVSINNLIVLLQLKGKLDEAEELVKQNLADCRRMLPPDHPDMLQAISNQADLYMTRSQWDLAEPLLREMLEKRARVLGADHPDTLNTLENLVAALQELDKLAEAEPLLTQLIEHRRQAVGDKHPDTVRFVDLLSQVYLQQGKLTETVALLRDSLERRRAAGADQASLMKASNSLATLLAAAGLHADAVPLFRDALKILEANVSTNDPKVAPQVAEILSSLAMSLLAIDQKDEAETLLRRAAKLDRAALPDGHWHTSKIDSLLGACLVAQGKYDEAEPLLLASFSILQINRPAQPQLADDALRRVIALYDAWGKTDEATEWRARFDAAKQQKPAATSAEEASPPKAK